VRAALLARAPRLPLSGESWLLAPHTVVSRGMELQSHWGAVDHGAQLPQQQLAKLVGATPAYYYVPSRRRDTKRKRELHEDTAPPAEQEVAGDVTGAGAGDVGAGGGGRQPSWPSWSPAGSTGRRQCSREPGQQGLQRRAIDRSK
jgi:hypothetical protein